MAARSALEGALVSAVAGAAAYVLAPKNIFSSIATGFVSAWGASTVSVAFLAFSRGGSFRWFMRAFGGGVAVRAAALAALMYASWGSPYELQSSLLVSYTGGILVLLLLEYRHLGRIKK